jgi:hypothetical protein
MRNASTNKQTNSVAFSPRANYTDWAMKCKYIENTNKKIYLSHWRPTFPNLLHIINT